MTNGITVKEGRWRSQRHGWSTVDTRYIRIYDNGVEIGGIKSLNFYPFKDEDISHYPYLNSGTELNEDAKGDTQKMIEKIIEIHENEK